MTLLPNDYNCTIFNLLPNIYYAETIRQIIFNQPSNFSLPVSIRYTI